MQIIRTIVPMLTFTLLLPALALAGTTVDQVVVYSDRAEVTRKAEAVCKGGTAEVLFAELPVQLDERTLRPSAAGKATAIGVSSRVVPLEEERDERVKVLRAEVEKVDRELRQIGDRQATLGERLITLDGYGSYAVPIWGEEMRGRSARPQSWAAVLDRLHAERLRVVEEHAELKQQQRQKGRARDALLRRLNHYNAGSVAEVRRATVAVECGGEARASVSLSYVVPGATWHPEYDLRFVAGEGRKVGPGRAELTVAAVIQQATGEDWEHARIVLSTSKPRLGSEAPRPAQLWVDGYEVGKQKVLVQATEQREKLDVGQRTTRQEPQAAELEDRGQSFVLKLPQRVTVHPDGRPYWFPVDVVAGKARSSLVTVPKLSPYVYQVVGLDNPAPYPLLPGRMHIFRHRSYVGDTSIPYRAPGEPMEVSLGIDEELQIERIDLMERNRKAGFLSGTKHMDRAYRVEVKSSVARKAVVEVRERIPVSKVDDVKVTLDEKMTSRGYQLDRHRGFITWNLTVPAGATGTVELHYGIHLPDAWQVGN